MCTYLYTFMSQHVYRNFHPFLQRSSALFYDNEANRIIEYDLVMDSLVGDYPALCEVTSTRNGHCPFCRIVLVNNDTVCVKKSAIEERKRLFLASSKYESDVPVLEVLSEIPNEEQTRFNDMYLGKQMKRRAEVVEAEYNIKLGINPWIISSAAEYDGSGTYVQVINHNL